MPALASPAALSIDNRYVLEIDGGRGSGTARTRFLRDHGDALITGLLQKAGLATGRWIFRMINAFHASGDTPVMRVRRADINGVHIWCKPGDNASGMKGVLIVTRDRGSPDELFRRLFAANNEGRDLSQDGAVPAVPVVEEVDVVIDDEELALALIAVADIQVAGDSFPDAPRYAAAVRVKSGIPRTVQEVMELLALCRENGWITGTAVAPIRTAAGAAFVDEVNSRGVVSPEPQLVAVAPVAAPVVAPAAPAPAPVALDVGYLLTAYKDKLVAIAALGGQIEASRLKQRDFTTKIHHLEAEFKKEKARLTMEYEKEKTRESELAGGLDAAALSKLLGVVK